MLVRRLSAAIAFVVGGAALGSACSSPKHPPHINDNGTGGVYFHPDSSADQSTDGQGGADAGDASLEAEASADSGGTSGGGGIDAGGSDGGGAAGTGGVDGGGSGGVAGADASESGAGTGGVDGGDGGDAGPPAHCFNTQLDTGETDVDCGDECPPCGTGKTCSVNSDCASQRCDSTAHTCNAPTCTDSVKNGNETDTDCGGANCNPCADNKGCLQASDCLSGVCSGTPLTCQVPTCSDSVKNGNETDVDCGGGCPTKCPRGSGCNSSTDCVTQVCTNNRCACPNGMITVPVPGGGGGTLCIDQYEVTYAQYTVFYNSNPAAQTTQCAWKTDYTPSANWPGTDSYPVRDVDWCDAYAYCQSMGKRLCGKIGGGAGDYSAFADATVSQWYDACSAQGASTYPYGSTFDQTKCNGYGYLTDDAGPIVGPLPGVRSYPLPQNSCIGGAPLLYDMSGNVAEWTDECQAAQDGGGPGADLCRVRGGGYNDTSAALTCAANRTMQRNATADDVGFRCCLD